MEPWKHDLGCRIEIINDKRTSVNHIDFFAHWTASNLEPVFHILLLQVLKSSSNAVNFVANSGTSKTFTSSSVRQQTKAATRAPAEVPEMTRGSSFASKRALITPKW